MSFPFQHQMNVAGHRGDSYNCFENTMEAFRAAYEAGSDMIETDIRLTADDELVLFHDAGAMRVAGVDVKIRELTLEQVRQLNVGSALHPAQVPTLEEFLQWAAPLDIWLNLELKEYFVPGNEDACRLCVDKTMELVEKYGLKDRVVMNSFDAWPLEYIDEKFDHQYMLHGFYPYSVMKNVNRDPAEYLYCACISVSSKKKEYFDYLLERNIEPWIGASQTSADQLEQAAAYGARLVTANDPGDALKKLKELGLRK